eukprot:gnl/TRDRNA2_/TRDRNA2_94096_c0_seq1.p1 gnl/TRDRNA2_/TRDRNA2_94096_c0~~gnl/TRDRNA2_/TRDRNA2_94096_c0_seq1.p1  ORF type:complete len:290 (-),score=26.87 gnl/TRDRNA2_/TRDRNA2_94096_c0_seq1:97-966(-)
MSKFAGANMACMVIFFLLARRSFSSGATSVNAGAIPEACTIAITALQSATATGGATCGTADPAVELICDPSCMPRFQDFALACEGTNFITEESRKGFEQVFAFCDGTQACTTTATAMVALTSSSGRACGTDDLDLETICDPACKPAFREFASACEGTSHMMAERRKQLELILGLCDVACRAAARVLGNLTTVSGTACERDDLEVMCDPACSAGFQEFASACEGTSYMTEDRKKQLDQVFMLCEVPEVCRTTATAMGMLTSFDGTACGTQVLSRMWDSYGLLNSRNPVFT